MERCKIFKKKIDTDGAEIERLETEIGNDDLALDPLRVATTKAKDEWDKIKGTAGGKDSAKTLKMLQATKDLLGENGAYKRKAELILTGETTNLRSWDRSGTDSVGNYVLLRGVLGIEDSVFDKAVGQGAGGVVNNGLLRQCVGRALNLPYSDAELKAAAKADEIDKRIWERIVTGTKYDLIMLTDRVWDTLLASAAHGNPSFAFPQVTPTKEVAGAKRARPLAERESTTLREDLLRERHDMVGLNTTGEFIELPGGQRVAVIVNSQGVNEVIGADGRMLGSLEYPAGRGRMQPASSEAVARLQPALAEALAQREMQIRGLKLELTPDPAGAGQFTFESGLNGRRTHRVIYHFSTNADGVRVADRMDEVPIVAGPPALLTALPGTDSWENFRSRYVHERALGLIARMQGAGRALRDRMTSDEVGTIRQGGEGATNPYNPLIWRDKITTATPGTSDYFEYTIGFIDGRAAVMKNMIVKSGPIMVGNPMQWQVDNLDAIATDPTAKRDLAHCKRMFESVFYHIEAKPSQERNKILAQVHNLRLTGLTGGRVYEISAGKDGALVLRDRTDPNTASPEEHDTFQYLNDELLAGRVTQDDLRTIRTQLGREYIRAIGRSINR